MSLYVRMRDPTGNAELATFPEFVRLEWMRKENEIGTLTMDLPPSYPLSLFRTDARLEIWRSIGNNTFLEGETIFFLRDWRYAMQGGQESLHLEAYDANYLYGYNGVGRVVPYNDLAYVEKVGHCDDLIKAIARENIGSLTLDASRDLSAYLTIQVDLGLAASSHKAFAFRDLMSIFKELATESFQRGAYLVFDTVYTNPTMLELRTYVNQRGIDHGRTSTNPVTVNRLNKALEDPILDFDHVDEVSYVYAGGQSAGDIRPIYALGDNALIGQSPFNRREQFVDASNTADADQMETEGRTALKTGRPKTILTGRVVDTDNLRYGLQYGFGDIVVAEDMGYSFNAHLNSIHGTYENGMLTFDNRIRGEL